MNCANPQCNRKLQYLRGGTLRLLELECEPEERTRGKEAGFPVIGPPSRYFWLCPECAERFVLKRWTTGGLELGSRAIVGGTQSRLIADPQPAVGPASVLHFRGGTARRALDEETRSPVFRSSGVRGKNATHRHAGIKD